MRKDDRSDQIEVELTSSGAEPSPFARHAGPHQAARPGRRADAPRTVVVAAVVGVLALILGWMVGRSATDGDQQVRPGVPTTLVRANVAAPIETVRPDATAPLETADADVTSATTNAVPTDDAAVGSDVEFAGSLVGQPIEIVAVGNGRRLLRLDLATGEFADQRATGQSFGQARVILGGDWILFPSGDANLPSTVVGGDRIVEEIDLGSGRNLIGDAMSGLWRITSDVLGDEVFAIEPIAITGEPIGAELELPGLPSGFDPIGGFVIEAAGGVYSVVGADRTRITTGVLLALGVEVAVADECDERLVCGLYVLDRATGTRRALDLDQPIGPSRLRSFEPIPGNSVSVDSGAAIVRVLNPIGRSSSQPTLGMIDLATSEVIEIGPAQNVDEAVWTPDGKFVLYNSGGRIMAFDRAERTESMVADELIAIDTFAIRPTGSR